MDVSSSPRSHPTIMPSTMYLQYFSEVRPAHDRLPFYLPSNAKYYLQIFLKYALHMTIRRFTLPDLILQQELMSQIWDFSWELVVLLSKNQLEAAQRIVPYVPMHSRTRWWENPSRSQMNMSDISDDSLEDLYQISRLVLRQNMRPGRMPMITEFAGHFVLCCAQKIAPRIQELIEYKFRKY